MHTFDDQLEVWDRAADRLIARAPLADLDRVIAIAGGCLTLAGGKVQLWSTAGAPPLTLHDDARALGWDKGDVLVASRDRMLLLGLDGTRKRELRGDLGITALARVGAHIVAGFQNGNVELFPIDPARPKPTFAFEGLPSSPIVSFLEGPLGTLVVGYASGHLGLWHLDNGARLESASCTARSPTWSCAAASWSPRPAWATRWSWISSRSTWRTAS